MKSRWYKKVSHKYCGRSYNDDKIYMGYNNWDVTPILYVNKNNINDKTNMKNNNDHNKNYHSKIPNYMMQPLLQNTK